VKRRARGIFSHNGAGRAPRHYSRLIDKTPAVKVGLVIVGAVIVFLAFVVLAAII